MALTDKQEMFCSEWLIGLTQKMVILKVHVSR